MECAILKKDLTKIQDILNLEYDIILVQETWLDVKQDILSLPGDYNYLYSFRRMDRRLEGKKDGGGTMIIYKDGIEVIKEVRLDKDSGLYQMVINTPKGTKTIWLGNVYLNIGSKSQIQLLFRNIEKLIPQNYLKNTFIVGDFNVNLGNASKERDLVVNLASSLGLRVCMPAAETRKGSILDFMVAPKHTNYVSSVLELPLSDHKAVIWEIDEIPSIERRVIRVVNKKLAESVSIHTLYSSPDTPSFLSNLSMLTLSLGTPPISNLTLGGLSASFLRC